MRFTSSFILFLTAFVLLCSCGNKQQQDDRPIITVSIPPQKWIVEQLADERVDVECILSSSSDAENFEMTLSQLVALEHSQVYLCIGGLPFEEPLLEDLHNNYPDLPVVDISEGVERIADSCHSHSHNHTDHATCHDESDPHIWLSLRNARIMARNIHNVLTRIDPEGRSTYDRNLHILDRKLKQADDSVSRMLQGISHRTFITWHPSLGYFARDYGLRQMSIQQEGKEVSPQQLAEAVKEIREHKPAVLFFEKSAQGGETATLSAESGTPAVSLRQLDGDFIPQLMRAAKALCDNQ